MVKSPVGDETLGEEELEKKAEEEDDDDAKMDEVLVEDGSDDDDGEEEEKEEEEEEDTPSPRKSKSKKKVVNEFGEEVSPTSSDQEEEEEEGEVEAGEIPNVEASAAAAAAERRPRRRQTASGEYDEEDGRHMSSEEMCNAAEQAAEAARACAASARIGKRVCELGAGGWGVLCDCAQTVLRTCRAASMSALKVGHAAMHTPASVTDALDQATDSQLDKRGERETRALMEAILSSVREGREAATKAKDCTDKAGEGAQVVLSLIRLPPNPDKLASAVGPTALHRLMCRVGEVLHEMATSVGEAAELAMSTAVSVEAMHRQAKIVADLASNCSAKEQQEMSSSGSDSDEDDEEDEELKAAKKAAKEAEAKRREEENERARKEQEEQGDPEANLGPGAKLRLATCEDAAQALRGG